MAALSDYLESKLLNHLFRSTPFSKPSGIAIALTSAVPLDSDSGLTMPELPSGVSKGSTFVSTNYQRMNLGNPATTGDATWASVGTDTITIFSVSGTSNSGNAVGMSGYFYPLYLDQPTALLADRTETGLGTGFSLNYQFKEFPSVTLYAPQSLAQSGKAVNPGYDLYDGNGFIKTNIGQY